MELQELADETGLALHVHHDPPCTPRWNKIEHRPFCHITQNSLGPPLKNRMAVVELIGATTNKANLKVESALDGRTCVNGIKIGKAELARLDIAGDPFHPEQIDTTRPGREPNEMRRALRDLLSFISDDSWQLQFVKLENPKKWPDYFDFSRNNDEPGASNIVLFSGGLNSLAGAVHELKHSNQRIVLVSHKSSPIAINRQTELARELRKRNGKRVFHVPVRVNMTKQQPAIEDTQRTRGFLFTAIAAVVAHLEGAHRIRLYENGIMSVNLPISTQVVGTRATRTTHPHFLKLLEKLIRLMQGGETTIDNPFIWMTKSEVVQVLRDPADRNLIAQSISCSNTREMTKMHWHCGTCAQCLQRRIGTLGADLGEADPKEGYAIDMLTGPRDSVESLQMAIDMIRSALEFRRLSDEGFTHRFAGEFSRLNVSFAGVTQAEAARNFVDLFRRHGNTVRNVLIDAAKANAEGLIDRTLPANCLVRIAVDQPGLGAGICPLAGASGCGRRALGHSH